MRVSLVVNNYNYGRFVGEAIDSALAQDWNDVEVVVVDDGSNDDSRRVIDGYGGRVVAVYQSNQGQAAAVNAGVAASSGQIICLLDADDLAYPTRACAVVDALSAHPDAGWCVHPLDYEGTAPPVQTSAVGYIDERMRILQGKPPRLPGPATSGLAFRRALLDAILPIPGMRIAADTYLKLVAWALAPGVVLAEAHGRLRVHGANAFTGSGPSDLRRLRSDLTVSRALLGRPETRRYGLLRGMGALRTAATAGSSTDVSAAAADFIAACSRRERVEILAHRALWLLRRNTS